MHSDSDVVAITGIGSYSSALAHYLLRNSECKIRLLGRSEARLANLQSQFSSNRITFILADIRDSDRLRTAFKGATHVYHAAALKVVGMSYIHTSEFIKTNVLGTKNVIDAARDCGVSGVLFISSDKACQAYNPYGIGKALGEAMITEANMHVPYTTRFASVRGGNVWGSRGSVIEQWRNSEFIHTSNPNITRFHLSMSYWLAFTVRVMREMHGGEVFIPICPTWKLGDLARVYAQVSGKSIEPTPLMRYGDKLHEVLVSEHEAEHTLDLDWGYCIEPSQAIRDVWHYESHPHAERLTREICSANRPRLSDEELRLLIMSGETK